MFDEFDVCQASGLGKTIHASADFGKEAIFFEKGAKVVFTHDIIGDGPCWNVEVFVLAGVSERGDEIKICEVDTKEFGTRCGCGAFQKQFGGSEIGHGSVSFALVVDEIAANCPANAIGIRLLWAVVCTDAKVCWLFAFGQFVEGNEMHGFGAFDGGVFVSLCQACNFFGATGFPFESVSAFEEMTVFFEFASFGI